MKRMQKQTRAMGKRTMASKLAYVKKNWQLYVFFLMPALILTIIFKYLPMGGLLIAFEDYNVIKGVFGSTWVGLEYFKRFLSSPDFMNYLLNTLKLSIYGLLWGFPVPIILALLLNQIRKQGIKKKIQLLIYAPNFVSVIVLCGMVRMFLSPVGVMYGLGMVISNLKRGISMLMQIPFAMMGAVRGIIQVVMYVFTMCIELLFTVYVYQFVCEFIVIFASVIETPISDLVKQADGMTESVIFGGRFSFLTNFVSPETLYNNRYLFVLGVFGLMIAVVLFTGHVLVKSYAYLSAYEYAVCKYYRMITCKEMLPVFDKWMAERKSLYVWDGVSEINGF